MSDLDDSDALEGGSGATFSVTRPPITSPGGDVQVVSLKRIDWSALIHTACAARTVADVEDLPFPAELGGLSRRALAVWCRHPWDTTGMTGRDGKPINAGEGDPLSWELVQHIPIYPRVEYPDRPVEALRASWQAMVDGDVGPVPPPDGDVGEWWPARVVVDRRNGKCWIDIDDRHGRPISHTLIAGASMMSLPTGPPIDAHGEPLRTVDRDDPIALVVESMRRRRIPSRAPTGRPPSASTVIASLTKNERYTCACELVEHHAVGQSAACRALSDKEITLRPDSLSRALRRRRLQRS